MQKIPAVVKLLVFLIIPLFFITWFILGIIVPEPQFSSTEKEIEFYTSRENELESTNAAIKLLKKDSLLLKHHAIFLDHFLKTDRRGKYLLTPEFLFLQEKPSEYYEFLIGSSDNKIRDIGYYGWIRYELFLNPDEEMVNLLDSITKFSDPGQSRVYELKGDVWQRLDTKKAIDFYKKEITVNSSNADAINKLITQLVIIKEHKESLRYMQLAELRQIKVNSTLKRYISYHLGFKEWMQSIYEPVFTTSRLKEIIVAALVVIIWILFMLNVDIFRDARLKIKIVVLFLAVILTPLVLMLYDMVNFRFKIFQEETVWKEIFITGLLEEAIKIFPVLPALLLFRKSFISPFTLLAASIASSLYFSFEENIIYFKDYYDITIVASRSIYSTTMHIISGAFVIYGIILFKYAKRSFLFIPLFFLLGISIHGVYNYSLMTGYNLFTIFLLIAGTFSLSSFINNSLNNSKNFDESKGININKPALLIIAGFSLIILAEFILNSFSYGFQEGENVFTTSLLKCGPLILVFSFSLTRFELEKGKWRFIDFSGVRKIDTTATKEKNITIIPFAKKTKLPENITLHTTVKKKIKSSKDEVYYYCKTTNTNFPALLVQFRDEYDSFEDYNVVVHLFLVKDKIPEGGFVVSNYVYLGLGIMGPGD